MGKIFGAIVGVTMLCCILAWTSPIGTSSESWYSQGGVGSKRTHTVVKGDTLSEIAETHDRNWRELAKINGLQIHMGEIDGKTVPIVWIKPGQVIELDKDDVWEVEDVIQYRANTRKIMEEHIFRMALIREPMNRLSFHNIDAVMEYHTPINTHVELREYVLKLKEKIKLLEQQSRYLIVDEIINGVAVSPAFPFLESQHRWIDERKMCFMLMGILDVESNAYFVKAGTSNARGIWQILPITYCRMYDLPTDRETRKEIAHMLMTDSRKGLECAMDYLNLKNDPRSALEYYYYGGHLKKYEAKKRAYACDVLKSANVMHLEANSLDKETIYMED